MLSTARPLQSHAPSLYSQVLVTFQAWVQQLVERRFGTATALAAAVGMQLSPFNRGVATGTLNLVNLLKLAKVAEAHPSTVLRMARKEQEADLLEELYGSGRDTLTTSARHVVDLWDAIPDEYRAPLLFTMRAYAEASGAHKPPAKKGSRG